MRLIGEIEKLLKKKLEIEPIELEDDRPRRPRRRDAEDEAFRPAAGREAERVAEQAIGRAAERSVERSQFFDQPYEPSGSGSAAWEKGPAPVKAPAPNIRPRKKIGSLLGGG
jgi:ATP-dependent RNA helicase RhlE